MTKSQQQTDTENISPKIRISVLAGLHLLVSGSGGPGQTPVESAVIYFGNTLIDLMRQAVWFGERDEQGFYLLVELTEESTVSDHLQMVVGLRTGGYLESRAAVSIVDGKSEVPVNVTDELVTLLTNLPKAEAERLISFSEKSLGIRLAPENRITTPQHVRFAVDLCCVLDSDIFVLVGSILDPLDRCTAAEARVGACNFDLLKDSFCLTAQGVNPDPLLFGNKATLPVRLFILAEEMPARTTPPREAIFTLKIDSSDAYYRCPVKGLPGGEQWDIVPALAVLDCDAALALNRKLSEWAAKNPARKSLAALMMLSREHLIQRLPISIEHTSPKCFLFIDQAIPVLESGVFLTGWFASDPADEVQLFCHRGLSDKPIHQHWLRHSRPDARTYVGGFGLTPPDDRLGFSSYISMETSSDEPFYITVQISEWKRSLRITLRREEEAGLPSIRGLLSAIDGNRSEMRPLIETQLGSAVKTIWDSKPKPRIHKDVASYGNPVQSPACSIIVPLYGRYDFAEYQLALFANDEELKRSEIIYVVDDPGIFNLFRKECNDLFELYRVPFVVAYAGVNFGFAGANNFGAQLARAGRMLLLNSDVMPKEKGWLGKLLRTYDELENPGLLGARLLYEDGTIQHIGISFRRYSDWGGLWINDHPSKGQNPSSFRGVQPVNAVTAACALIDTQLYRQLGGFSEDYIVGDFEDSDLCLRALELGKRSYISHDVELYHLERQSQNRVGNSIWRANLTAYNCWLHNQRWSKVIDSLGEVS